MSGLPFPVTPTIFFTGKGGVGKTSLACATAVALADAGRHVLLVSTDPASNLDEVLETALSTQPMPVGGVPNLSALNIDPEAAAREYRERIVGPYRTLLPEATVRRMEEQLSGGCTLEIAAFDQFTNLLGGGAASTFDHVVFDTAPTGHTLRLLALPAAWTAFMDTNTTGTSCLGPLSGLQAQRAVYAASLAALADAARTTVFLVARAEPSSFAEAARTAGELGALGIVHQRLVVNGTFAASDRGDRLARALEARSRSALDAMPPALAALPRTEVPLRSRAPMGIDGIRALFEPGDGADGGWTGSTRAAAALPTLADLVDRIEGDGPAVVLTMGKGGVGKTTIAAAIATELARRGRAVTLSTTDPAAHLAAAVGDPIDNLQVTRIDAIAETQAYREEVLAAARGSLDARGLDLLEEDLRSPCTEEVAVFRAFARTVAEGRHRFVILDTAPTGHTLLLLDAAEAYHRDVSRSPGAVPDAVRGLLPALRDRRATKVVLVTLPEATPVHEAARLQDDLRRAAIEPFAWVVNQTLVGSRVSDPLLVARQSAESSYLAEVCDRHAVWTIAVRWRAEPPVGAAGLQALSAREVAHAGA